MGERRGDVVLIVHLLGKNASTKIIFIERQQIKDKFMNIRCFDISILLMNYYFGSKIDGIVLCAGYENEDDYLTYELKDERSSMKFDIQTFILGNCALEVLESDDRLFARVLYIALLEKAGGKTPAEREKIARKVLKHLKRKNLSPEAMRACRLFALTILRLDDEAICDKLRGEFKMYIFEHDEKLLELGRYRGRKEGLQEGDINARREMVMKMLVKGLPLATISELSGFSEQDILALRDGPRRNEAV
ncbi:MAG: hypothetical protein LBR53_09035 [Deltaproteobacteria bacterium]|jgi:hypothetical protein|nr:hypothetical protein [Deltaproteobacteria bacterium]